jgi:poly(A) polymerase
MDNYNAALKIVKKLKKAGFNALFAGGCVRDMLLRKNPNDYDVATSARPEEVTKLFRRTIKVGAKFGVVIVLIGSEQVEVATFRVEGGYSDGRHPSYIDFADSRKDARRRDFTVNAMFYDPLEEKVVDYVHGREDLEKGIIKTVGEPNQRFGEDYLRMLRAVRFSVQLDFRIEENTRKAICEKADNISVISGERIAAELERILACPGRAKGVRQLLNTGLGQRIFPGFEGEKAMFGAKVLDTLTCTPDMGLGLACMFAGFSTDFAVKSCKALKLSTARSRKLQHLLEKRGQLLKPDVSLAELKLAAGDEYFEDLLALQTAIQKAGGESTSPLEKLKQRIAKLRGTELRPEPLLNGYELMELGVEEGRKIGELQSEMYTAQLNEEITTKKEAAEWIKNKLKSK